jgi:hypothetical protein
VDEGIRLGVVTTPAFFMNGSLIMGRSMLSISIFRVVLIELMRSRPRLTALSRRSPHAMSRAD